MPGRTPPIQKPSRSQQHCVLGSHQVECAPVNSTVSATSILVVASHGSLGCEDLRIGDLEDQKTRGPRTKTSDFRSCFYILIVWLFFYGSQAIHLADVSVMKPIIYNAIQAHQPRIYSSIHLDALRPSVAGVVLPGVFFQPGSAGFRMMICHSNQGQGHHCHRQLSPNPGRTLGSGHRVDLERLGTGIVLAEGSWTAYIHVYTRIHTCLYDYIYMCTYMYICMYIIL